MKKLAMLVVLLAFAVAGCTTPSLERHAVTQIQTVTDFRYQATLRCLAMVAANHGTLPSYARSFQRPRVRIEYEHHQCRNRVGVGSVGPI